MTGVQTCALPISPPPSPFSLSLSLSHTHTHTQVQDLRLHLEKHWAIKVPGFSEAEQRAAKKANMAPEPKKPTGRPPGAAGVGGAAGGGAGT